MIPVGHVFWTVLAGVLGALFGSFLNVVVYRLPAGLSVVRPGSRCGACGTPIAPWNNIPVLSWALLRGKAACCRAPFSVRYPLVEAATAAIAVALWLRLANPAAGEPPQPPEALAAWALGFTFACVLLCIALIDLDTLRIPDVLSLPLIPLGLLAAWTSGKLLHVTLEQSLLGLLIGGGTLLVITYGYFALTGREGMGLGDYRLMAAVGAWLGWQSLLFLLMASALQGLVFAAIVKLFRLENLLPGLDDPDPPGFRDPDAPQPAEPAAAPDEAQAASDDAPPAAEGAPAPEGPRPLAIPYGPFIALAALEWLLFEPALLRLLDEWVYGGLAR